MDCHDKARYLRTHWLRAPTETPRPKAGASRKLAKVRCDRRKRSQPLVHSENGVSRSRLKVIVQPDRSIVNSTPWNATKLRPYLLRKGVGK